MTITVIYGPGATGKTFHADKFRTFYRCARILDDWYCSNRKKDHRHLQQFDLVLTNVDAQLVAKHIPDARLIHIQQAREDLNLGPIETEKWLEELRAQHATKTASPTEKVIGSSWNVCRSGNGLTVEVEMLEPDLSVRKLTNIRMLTSIDGQLAAFAKDGTRFDIVCA